MRLGEVLILGWGQGYGFSVDGLVRRDFRLLFGLLFALHVTNNIMNGWDV